jgi:peptidoglycan/xylan/chitin deacetylase (PgdA/CDA1 family)
MRTATGWCSVRADGRCAPLILMYHAVDSKPASEDPDNLFVPVDSFASHLEALERRGLRPITLDAYLDGRYGPGSVLLTFDDAYVSTLTQAAPLLAARGWPAVVYVSSQTIGRTSHWNADPHERLLDVDELHELQRVGFTIGAHGRTHSDLRGLPADALRAEVEGCGEDLADLLGRRPRSFAYPFGSHDAAARAAVARAGYEMAFAVHEAAGRFAVPRVDINAVDTARTIAVKLHPAYPFLRRAAGTVPPLRRAAHRVLGYARR